MFSFFKRKPPPAEPAPVAAPPLSAPITTNDPSIDTPVAPVASVPPARPPVVSPAAGAPVRPAATPDRRPMPSPVPAAPPVTAWASTPSVVAAAEPEPEAVSEATEAAARQSWRERLRGGLRKTGSAITTVFTGTRIDEDLYEELEAALLMADTGVRATQFLLDDLRRRVKEAKATDPAKVRGLLADALADLLRPLEHALVVGRHAPTVIMVVGVNGAGKTTSIGKLTRYLADHGQKVLLAAADTFRAAAREQLAVWAERSDARGATSGSVAAGQPAPAPVEFVSQAGGDPASVSFDAVVAGRARRSDVVIADTAGRLPTQLHLMEELKKIKRVITKAQADAPHEVLLVIDGNTGQNALNQVKAFDEALQLTGLIITKLDGTAKGGVLAAIALWARERAAKPGGAQLPVYFIGIGEQLEDLQTFKAREFSQALVG